MVNIKGFFRELKYEIFKNILLTTFLKSVIAFFIFDIVASLIDLWYIFSFIFAGAYFLVSLFKQMKYINIRVFEKNNPEVREMLSTAADNIDKNNIVVAGLFKDVLDRARKLSSGTLIVPRTILIMVLIIPVLAIADFEMNPLKIEPISQDVIVENIMDLGFVQSIVNMTRTDGEIEEDGLLDDDIYGDRRIAELGAQEIDIKMNTGFHTDLTKPTEEDKEMVTFKNYPDDEDVEIIQDERKFGEFIEESDLARKYNEKIRNLQ